MLVGRGGRAGGGRARLERLRVRALENVERAPHERVHLLRVVHVQVVVGVAHVVHRHVRGALESTCLTACCHIRKVRE